MPGAIVGLAAVIDLMLHGLSDLRVLGAKQVILGL